MRPTSRTGTVVPLPFAPSRTRPAKTLQQHLDDTDDPHGTKASIPVVFTGAGSPADHVLSPKEGDLFVSTTTGVAYRCAVSANVASWNVLPTAHRVPAGGTSGQVLVKASSADDDAQWQGGFLKKADFSAVESLTGATLNQVAAKVNELLAILKPCIAAALLALPCLASTVPPETPFGDAPPGNTVYETVSESVSAFLASSYRGGTNAMATALTALEVTNAVEFASGNVLHFNGPNGGTVVEGTAKIVEFVNAGKPVYCLYGGSIWTYLSSITPATASGVQVYYLTFTCPNPSAYASGVSSPLVLTIALFPSIGAHQTYVGTWSLLPGTVDGMTNSTAFATAVRAVQNNVSGGQQGASMPDHGVVLTNGVLKTVSGTVVDTRQTNLMTREGTGYITGDREVFAPAGAPVVTWKTVNGYTGPVAGLVPAGLVFYPEDPDITGGDYSWYAPYGNTVYRIRCEAAYGGGYYYQVIKGEGDSAFPRSSTTAGAPDAADTSTISFADGAFVLTRVSVVPSGTPVLVDRLATTGDVQTVRANLASLSGTVSALSGTVASNWNVDLLKQRIGAASSSGNGYSSYGLVTLDPSQPLSAMTRSYYDLTLRPSLIADMKKVQNLPGNAVVWTNGLLKTAAGSTVYPKAQAVDMSEGKTWTLEASGGRFYLTTP